MDRLIADDRQHRRHRAWTLGGSGVAAALAAVALAPALVAGSGPEGPGLTLPPIDGGPGPRASFCPVVEPKPTGPSAPQSTQDTVRARPTERPDDGIARLTRALLPLLSEHLPAGLTIKGTLPGCESAQFVYEKTNSVYYAHALLVRGGQTDNLTVTVVPTAAEEPAGCAAAPGPGACTSVRLPGGGTLATGAATPGDDGAEQRWAFVQRTDGTSVRVVTDNVLVVVESPGGVPTTAIGPPPMVTVDQLAAIASAPGLTLYP
ncbi:hypothetical protein AB0J20_19835 [Micromonospora costi]|uniref:hypothetical protein n=1 Tax=Micromonospora costi TaxID=1530042 RepID=UPI003406B4D7